jgi:hypothetical protein
MQFKNFLMILPGLLMLLSAVRRHSVSVSVSYTHLLHISLVVFPPVSEYGSKSCDTLSIKLLSN